VSREQRVLMQMLNATRLLDAHELGVNHACLERSETAKLLQLVLTGVPQLSEILAVTFFEHSHISRTHA